MWHAGRDEAAEGLASRMEGAGGRGQKQTEVANLIAGKVRKVVTTSGLHRLETSCSPRAQQGQEHVGNHGK